MVGRRTVPWWRAGPQLAQGRPPSPPRVARVQAYQMCFGAIRDPATVTNRSKQDPHKKKAPFRDIRIIKKIQVYILGKVELEISPFLASILSSFHIGPAAAAGEDKGFCEIPGLATPAT